MISSLTAYHHFIFLMRNQWKSPQAIRKIREKKIRRLLIHAYENVPFYRSQYEAAKANPYDFKKLEDLHRFPLISKEQLQERPVEETTSKTADKRRCKQFSTSGTTGVPLLSYFTRHDSTLKNLAWIRVFLNSGMKPWHKAAAFIGQKKVKSQRSWYEFFGLWRRKEISTWTPPSSWVEELRHWKPRALHAYVMTLKILAEEAGPDRPNSFRPEVIFHSSALLDEASRVDLEKTLGCPIFDIYGSDEAGCIAWECKTCHGYHISMDMLVVEILKNGKPVSPGESGEVVITNLHSYAMPFIRYRQNDIVTLSARHPVCGRTFPLIETIEGRTDDFVILGNGRKISPHPIYHSIDPVPGIKRWRLNQESLGLITLEIEPGAGFSSDSRQTIVKNLRKLMGESICIEVVLRNKLAYNPTVKFRAVSSKVGG